jgi:signal transduction histidine kinase
VHSEILRTELSRRSPAAINFFEVFIQPAPAGGVPRDEPVLNYIRSTLAGQRLDLVVTVGGPAAAFIQRYREQLFPGTAVVYAGVDAQFQHAATLTANETVVAGSLDVGRILDNLLVLLPDTTTIFAVMGTSGFERSWRDELTREFARFRDKVRIEWLDDLSFAEQLSRVSALPPHSAIFYASMNVDGKGILQSDERALVQLREVANAPVFGVYDFQLGRGIVGGPLMSMGELARRSADVALRILQGELAATITSPVQGHGAPTYDWRELRRWNIREARLPAGSAIQFRQSSVWDQYKTYIAVVATVVAVQSVLIAGLVVQRVRRRRTERALRNSERHLRQLYEQNRDLAGRLINAQEEERRRIARDLHDDLSQQLAGLSIMLSGLKHKVAKLPGQHDIDQSVTTLQGRASTLAEAVRNLSHELHPTVLQHAGLVASLRRHCADVAQHHHVTVAFEAADDLDMLDAEIALCLYRITQEALTNAIRHARAHAIRVGLVASGGTIELSIADDGVGFVTGERTGAGLGLRSIEERVRLTGGDVSIESEPGHGTTVRVRIPSRGAEIVAGGMSASPGGPDQPQAADVQPM